VVNVSDDGDIPDIVPAVMWGANRGHR
jgi:hypothetical protein